MQTEQPWYVDLRSKALSIVYLTERDDLIIYRDKEQYGLDVMVSISKNGKDVNRLFGVEVQAIESSSKVIQNDEIFNIEGVDISPFKLILILKKITIPICLFFFTIDNNNGYYKWIIEPILDKENGKKLKFNRNPEFRKLTNQAINNIVSLVNQWYESKPTGSVVLPHQYQSDLLNELKQIRHQRAVADDINHEINEVKSKQNKN